MNTLSQALSEENEVEEATETDVIEPKKSLRGAINSHCRDCIYDATRNAGLGSWRQQVEACTVTKCALYEVRPVSKPRKVLTDGIK